jgi:hypothetical protein
MRAACRVRSDALLITNQLLRSVGQTPLHCPLGRLIYRLIKNGQGYKEPELHTYGLKYKDQILNSLRKRASSFGFDLVQVPKAA